MRAVIVQAVSAATYNNNFETVMKDFGSGPKTGAVFKEMYNTYVSYYNAYFNQKGDTAMPEAQKDIHTKYLDTFRSYLEQQIKQQEKLLTARSKDLTQSSTLAYDDTRHQDLIEAFDNGITAAYKASEKVLSDPKATDKEKNEAKGAVDAYVGLIKPFADKVNEAYKQEWTQKQAVVGPKIDPSVLKAEDKWSP